MTNIETYKTLSAQTVLMAVEFAAKLKQLRQVHAFNLSADDWKVIEADKEMQKLDEVFLPAQQTITEILGK